MDVGTRSQIKAAASSSCSMYIQHGRRSAVSAPRPRNLIPLTNVLSVVNGNFHNRPQMNEFHQLATAMLAIAFAAMMLVASQLFVETRSARLPTAPTAPLASMPSDK